VSEAISLTPHAVKLLETDYPSFRKECGDGFIAVMVEGAEITGTLVISDQSAEDSSNLALSLNGSYGPASFTTTLTDTLKQATSSHRFTLNYIQSGGAGGVVATDQNGLLQAISGLAASAQAAPLPLSVIVRDYRSLPNWPKKVKYFSTTADQLTQIMDLYWQADAIFTQAMDAKQSLAETGQFRYMKGFNFTAQSLEALIDQIKDVRSTLTVAATECYNNHGCTLPSIDSKAIYSLAVQLPLPWPPQTPSARDLTRILDEMTNVAASFNNEKTQRVLAVRNIHSPNCFQENHQVTQAFEHDGFPGNIQSRLDQFRAEIDALPARLREDSVNYYGRDIALRRCSASGTSPDCKLTQADFDSMVSLIPLSGLHVVSDFDSHIDEYGPCPGGITQTRYLQIGVQ